MHIVPSKHDHDVEWRAVSSAGAQMRGTSWCWVVHVKKVVTAATKETTDE